VTKDRSGAGESIGCLCNSKSRRFVVAPGRFVTKVSIPFFLDLLPGEGQVIPRLQQSVSRLFRVLKGAEFHLTWVLMWLAMTRVIRFDC
jgi:hypothetical protein